jgi:amidohydrolase
MALTAPKELTLASIRAQNDRIFEHLVSIRRHLHQYPELAFEEHETAALVSRELERLGIEHQTGIAKTGVVGYIVGEEPGPTLALRADMDALPILEETDWAYKSKIPGRMHACGHDFHTASLLGVADILQTHRAQLRGCVQLVFQPSEEKLPGGASVMISEGVLQTPGLCGIVGQHVMPLLEVGKVGIRSGQYMASADEIYITVYGQGGHGAQPHTTVDPVAIGAQLITALQQVVSRRADPRMPSVLTFGKVQALGATNVIPPKLELEGTFRTFDESWRAQAHELIRSIAHGLVEGMGGRVDLEIRRGYPVLHNDPTLTAHARQWIEEYVGANNVVSLDLWMASEDFAYYTHHTAGCFYRIGTRRDPETTGFGLHHPRFNVDEEALRLAPGLMAWVALRELGA